MIHAYLVANIVALFALVFATSVLMPEPLPQITARLPTGSEAAGRLVAISGSGDYLLAEEGDDSVSVFPSARVESAVVVSQDRTPERSLLQVVTGRDP